MTAKVANPEARRIQMTEQLRKSKRREVVSKKREKHGAELDPPERHRTLRAGVLRPRRGGRVRI